MAQHIATDAGAGHRDDDDASSWLLQAVYQCMRFGAEALKHQSSCHYSYKSALATHTKMSGMDVRQGPWHEVPGSTCSSINPLLTTPRTVAQWICSYITMCAHSICRGPCAKHAET